jgi:hypothetical protein
LISVGGSMSNSPATVPRPGTTVGAGCWPLERKLSNRKAARSVAVNTDERIATRIICVALSWPAMTRPKDKGLRPK